MPLVLAFLWQRSLNARWQLAVHQSSRSKDFAHEDFVHHRSQAVVVRLNAGKDVINFKLIRSFHVTSSGVLEQLFDQVFREQVASVFGEDFLQLPHIAERLTGWQFSRRVNFGRLVLCLGLGIVRAGSADRIKRLQRKSKRVNVSVTHGTGFILAM